VQATTLSASTQRGGYTTLNRFAFEVEPVAVDLKIATMRVLAIDASLRNTGVAIIDANSGKPISLYFGTIHNASSLRSSSCLVAIRDRLVQLIREHEPDCCAIESVIYVQSYKTAIILGAARGAAILAAAENGLPVFEYSPRRIKQSTVGHGAAAKNQVGFMVRALLGLTETPDADAADALAIALTHLRAQEAERLGIAGCVQI
jgi:crossover junction endodeoxyribonuclease RuvC